MKQLHSFEWGFKSLIYTKVVTLVIVKKLKIQSY